MKTLILSAALLFSVAVNASNANPTNEKVTKTFNQIFSNAQNVNWSNTGKYFQAAFTAATIKTRAIFDAKGNLVQTIRYYGETELPSNVLYNVKKAFPGNEVFGVTEVSNQNGIQYNIVLRNDDQYTNITTDDSGEVIINNEFERADK